MVDRRRKFDEDFKIGAVRIVRESGKPIAQVARELGLNEGTLGNWIARDQAARDGSDTLSRDDLAELKRLRAEHSASRSCRRSRIVDLHGTAWRSTLGKEPV
jgi:transposase